MNYTKYDELTYAMNSYSSLKETILEKLGVKLPTTVGDNVPIIQPKITISTNTYSFDTEEEKVDICIGISNESKFITFLRLIRSGKNTNSIMYVDENRLTVIIRPNSTPPFLIMRFPTSNPNIFTSPSAIGKCFKIPIEQIKLDDISTNTQNYIFYFRKKIWNSQSVSYELIYKSGSMEQHITTQAFGLNYINEFLRITTSSDLDDTMFTVMPKSEIEKQRVNLNEITLLTLDRIEQNSDYTEFSSNPITDKIELEFSTTGMKTKIKSPHNTLIYESLTHKESTPIWQIQTTQSYEIIDRTILLKMQSQNSILSSDSKYRALGVFGSFYVYIKIISDHPANISHGSVINNLSRLFDGSKYIFEMYFCKKMEAK